MRFKEYLEEAKHRRDISLEKAMELLEANCKDALQNFDKPLWRGSRKAAEEAYLIAGEDGQRTSKNTANYYTILLDEFLPSLGYPKRSKSIILGNNANYGYASGFGQPFAIFPYDGVKIGVCPDNDMWYTKVTITSSEGRSSTKNIEKWNQTFKDAGYDEDSYTDFRNSVISQLNDPHAPSSWSKAIFGKDPSKVGEILKAAYGDPEKMNLHLATSKNIKDYEDERRELWIGGKCVAIRKDIWEQIKKQRQEQQ